ncbi:MAG: hypothetical protein M3536_00080 [Actinomycetota bacterium]|nr:hypothetical protein [Actinomycetota bacterium]
MSRWVSIPNGQEKDGMMAINLDHVVVFYDLGAREFDGDPEPIERVNVILSDGSKRVLNMTAREFGGLISFQEPIFILEEVKP